MDYFRYNLTGLSSEATAFISWAVGLLILTRDVRSRLHQSFFLITTTGALWLLGWGMISLVYDPTECAFWLKVNYLAVPFISPSVYLFSIYWNGQKPGRTAAIAFMSAIPLALLVSVMAESIFYFEEFPGGRVNRVYSTALAQTFFACIIVGFFSFGTAAFRNFYRAWKSAASPMRRAQCGWFLLAASIGYTGSVDFFVAQGLPVYPFGFASFLTFVLLIAYAIVRYQLLNIDIFIRKFSLIILIYATLIGITTPFLVRIFRDLLKETPGNTVISLVGLALLGGGILSTGPLIYAFIIRRNIWIKGNATAGITHELKSPLSAIQSAVDIMICNQRAERPTDPQYLKMIDANARRLDRLVQDLLHIVQIQDEQISIDRKSFDFLEMIQHEAQEYRAVAEARGILISVNAEKSASYEGDREKLRQSFSNILSNAVKFSPEKGVISIRVNFQPEHLSCFIVDRGAGISRDQLPQIFDRFFVGHKLSKGSGLGLSIARAWIEAHGGRIWAESEGAGKGTTITFTLPRF